MREIKFRAWSKLLKKYVPIWSAIDTSGDNVLRAINNTLVIDQYTGVNDENNFDIYVNDIVKMTYIRGHHEKWDMKTFKLIDEWNDLEVDVIGKVEIWPSKGAVLTNIRISDDYILVKNDKLPKLPKFLNLTKYCHVISNIHENEYLLEEK